MRREKLESGATLILGARAAGKSTVVAKWLIEDPKRVAIVGSRIEADLLVIRAVEHGGDKKALDRQVYSIEQVKNGVLRGRTINDVAVDNIEYIVQRLIHAPISLMTASAASTGRTWWGEEPYGPDDPVGAPI